MALVARWSKEAENTFDEIIEYLVPVYKVGKDCLSACVCSESANCNACPDIIGGLRSRQKRSLLT